MDVGTNVDTNLSQQRSRGTLVDTERVLAPTAPADGAAEGLSTVALDPEQMDRIVRSVPSGIENIQAIYPLSPLQEGMLFHHLLDSEADTYVLSTLIELDSYDLAGELIEAVQRVMDRHDVLRTAVMWSGLPKAVNVVHRWAPLRVEETTLATEQDLADEIDQRMTPGWQRFDLTKAPLVRLLLLRREDESKVAAILQTHHLICDHQSLRWVVQEVMACLDDRGHQLHEPRSYGEYVSHALASVREHDAEGFFKRKLASVEQPSAPFGLMDVRGGNRIVEAREHIDDRLSRRIRAQARRLGVSAARMFHAAWGLVVAQVTGSQDVVFGTVLLSSQQRGPQARPMVGLSVNTLPLRLRLQDVTVRELVERTHHELAELMEHEAAPLALAQRCAGISSELPLFTSLLNFRRGRPEQGAEAAQSGKIRVLARGEAWTHYPITLTIDDAGEAGFLLMAKTHRSIDPRRVLQLLGTALESLAEIAPESPAWALSVLSEAERRKVLEDFNPTAGASNATLIHSMFEHWAQRTPDAVAIVHGEQSLTFEELNARANQLARYLSDLGVGPERVVAVCFERGVEMVIALLAVLKSGGAYVPIDPAYPTDRLADILEDSAPVSLLTQPSIRERLAGSLRCPVVIVDQMSWDRSPWSALASHNLDPAKLGLEPFNLAYVIYTSGSTGRPKGVMVEHRNLAHFIHGLEERIHSLRPDCRRIAWNSSFAFDMAAKAWAQLTQGRSVHLLDESTRLDGHRLLEFLIDNQIEAIECTPSHLRMMLDAGLLTGRVPSLRKVLLGGEPIDKATWRALAAFEQTRFFNMYGPTECSVDASCGPIDGSAPNIGSVMPGARIYILDAHRQPVPMGITGEIYIGGAGVARGYLHRPELTAERFVTDPFSSQSQARMYKTGDLGRWRTDGTIEYLGRNDHQVKVRGYRIELEEIQSQLTRHEQVKDAALVVREDVAGEKRLVAYVVSKDPSAVPGVDALRAHLKAVLPEFMVPAAFVMLGRLPLTPNGKLDRKALPAPELGAYASRKYEPPRGEVEEILAGIWRSLLRVERVGRHDNFFELGGHSLLAMQVMTRIESALSVELPIRALFDCPTLDQLSQRIHETQQGDILSSLRSLGPEADTLLRSVASMSDVKIKEWLQALAMESSNE